MKLQREKLLSIVSVLALSSCLFTGTVNADTKQGVRGESIVKQKLAINRYAGIKPIREGIAFDGILKLEQKAESTSKPNWPHVLKPEPPPAPPPAPQQAPQPVAKPTPAPAQRIVTVRASAYTASCEGCTGRTAIGINLHANPNIKLIAVDPNVIPLGKRVYVEGYGEAITGDTGGAIRGNKIDIYMARTQDALNWGVRTIKVTILN